MTTTQYSGRPCAGSGSQWALGGGRHHARIEPKACIFSCSKANPTVLLAHVVPGVLDSHVATTEEAVRCFDSTQLRHCTLYPSRSDCIDDFSHDFGPLLPTAVLSAGFLPSIDPLRRLPQAELQPWEAMAAALPSLLAVGRARKPLETLPVLSIGLVV